MTSVYEVAATISVSSKAKINIAARFNSSVCTCIRNEYFIGTLSLVDKENLKMMF